MLLENNLLHELPPFLSEVRKLEEVKFSGNNLYFPPAEVLAKDWSSIKKYLKQFMTSSMEEKCKAEMKTLTLTLSETCINPKRGKGQQNSKIRIASSTEDGFSESKFDYIRYKTQILLKLSRAVDDVFRKLERVKRFERKKKLAEIQRENEIIRKYADIWRKNVSEGIREQPYSIFIKAQKQAYRYRSRKSSGPVDLDNQEDTNLEDIRKRREVIDLKIDFLINGKDSLSTVFAKPDDGKKRNNSLLTVKKVVSVVSTLVDDANKEKEREQVKYCSDSSFTKDDEALKTTWLRSLSDSGFESKELEEKDRIAERRVTTAMPRPSKPRLRESRRELRQLAEAKRQSAESGSR